MCSRRAFAGCRVGLHQLQINIQVCCRIFFFIYWTKLKGSYIFKTLFYIKILALLQSKSPNNVFIEEGTVCM